MHEEDFHHKPTWTRYICTIGPASSSAEVLEGLIRTGASIIRNNFSHCTHDEYRERKRIVEEINARLGTKAQMLGDLQGPNIRVGKMPADGVMLEAGNEYTFFTKAAGREPQEGDLFINDEFLHLDLKVGEPITFADGALEGEVLRVEGAEITIRMINSGRLKSRKSINVPETNLVSSPALTEKDLDDFRFLLEEGVDWVGLSFVSSRKEVDQLREMIGDRPVKIISKIERRAAIKHIFEIIEASDAIMIARGDLGIELPMEEVPIIQRTLTSLCENAGKPVITATQMLLSLTHSDRPTRAEVSDVANAVFARSDAVMLSEETAEGHNPVHALATMVKIARRVEEYLYNRPNYLES